MLLNYYLKNTYDFIYETLFLHHLNLISRSHLAKKTDLCVLNISESTMTLMIERCLMYPCT